MIKIRVRVRFRVRVRVKVRVRVRDKVRVRIRSVRLMGCRTYDIDPYNTYFNSIIKSNKNSDCVI